MPDARDMIRGRSALELSDLHLRDAVTFGKRNWHKARYLLRAATGYMSTSYVRRL